MQDLWRNGQCDFLIVALDHDDNPCSGKSEISAGNSFLPSPPRDIFHARPGWETPLHLQMRNLEHIMYGKGSREEGGATGGGSLVQSTEGGGVVKVAIALG